MKILDVPQSGSVAGQTSSRNRFGQYRRTRAIPVNPDTSLQGLVRDNMAHIASAWAGLTAPQRAAWEGCAVNFPKVDSLGQAIVLTGFQQFVRVNLAILRTGGSILSDVPAETIFSSNAIGATAVAGTPALSVTFTPPNPGQVLLIDASQQVSAGRSYWSDFRRLVERDDAATSPYNGLTAYTAKFGALVEGQRIFFRSSVMNECGVIGPRAVISIIVGA